MTSLWKPSILCPALGYVTLYRTALIFVPTWCSMNTHSSRDLRGAASLRYRWSSRNILLFSCVNRSLIRYSFRTGAKAIRYYVNIASLNIECSAFAFDFNISLVFIIRPLVQHRVLHIVFALVSLVFINGLPYKLKDRGHNCTFSKCWHTEQYR